MGDAHKYVYLSEIDHSFLKYGDLIAPSLTIDLLFLFQFHLFRSSAKVWRDRGREKEKKSQIHG